MGGVQSASCLTLPLRDINAGEDTSLAGCFIACGTHPAIIQIKTTAYYLEEGIFRTAQPEKDARVAIPFLPIVLLALPLAEIAVFVLVGSEIGVLATIALVLATSMLGAVLLRFQGFGALARIRATMEAGGSPGRDLVHAVMIMSAGFLLLLPGFITDCIGLLLFIPPVREFAWRLVRQRIVVVETAATGRRQQRGNTIDLDAEDFSRDAETPRPRPAIDDDRP